MNLVVEISQHLHISASDITNNLEAVIMLDKMTRGTLKDGFYKEGMKQKAICGISYYKAQEYNEAAISFDKARQAAGIINDYKARALLAELCADSLIKALERGQIKKEPREVYLDMGWAYARAAEGYFKIPHLDKARQMKIESEKYFEKAGRDPSANPIFQQLLNYIPN